MTNLENKNEILLEEFKLVAASITPSSGFQGVFSNSKFWVQLKLTELMQRLGYNKIYLSAARKDGREQIILNIGCNTDKNHRYLNTDLIKFLWVKSALKALFLRSRIEYELLLSLTCYDKSLSESADGIVLSHVLEHIPPLLAIPVLKNCLAYLKQGGCIRVCVPELGEFDTLSDSIKVQKVQNRMLAKNSIIYGHGHKFMYNNELLKLVMEEAGFKEIKQSYYKEGLLGETDLLNRRDGSIYMTAVRA